jgi:N-acyl-phosphatidylethanolamine-hydrolysing phospholipase D
VAYDAAGLALDPGITWIGHSTFLVRMDGVGFLTDPIFSRRASPLSFMGPTRMVPPGVPLRALADLDFVLLSHDHYDHADRPTLERLVRRGLVVVAPLGLGEWVRKLGGRGRVIELDWWEDAEVGGVRVHCVPARHFSGRSARDRNRRLWAGYVVAGPSRRFHFVGDTGYSSVFREIGRRLGPMDLEPSERGSCGSGRRERGDAHSAGAGSARSRSARGGGDWSRPW